MSATCEPALIGVGSSCFGLVTVSIRRTCCYASRVVTTMTLLPDLFSLLALFIQMAGFPTLATQTETIVAKQGNELADKDTASMGLISAGPFTMGREGASPDEQPTHQVSLTAFYIDKYEVTVAEYAKFLKS